MKGLLAKLNRIMKRNNSKKFHIFIGDLTDSEPQIEAPNLSVYPQKGHSLNEQPFDSIPIQREVPGEFYEPDPEILEVIGNKTGFSKKELTDRGICTSLRSLYKSAREEKNIAIHDSQLAKLEIDHLRQKYK